MRLFISLFIMALSLTGCVTTRVGNFATAPINVYQMMVNDTVSRLITLYPPALTCFQIKQKTQDPFGAMLVKTLRLKGYSIIESRSPKTKNQPTQGIPLAYVVDSPRLPTLYRVSVMIGCHTLSRGYVFNQGHLYPEGSWTHKE